MGSALLVGAPLAFGCDDGIPTSNPVYVEPTHNVPPPLTTPTMDGMGVPLPSPNTVPQPIPIPDIVAAEEPTTNTVAPDPPAHESRRFAPNPGPSERGAPTE